MFTGLIFAAGLVAPAQTAPKPFDLACRLSESLPSRKTKDTPFIVMGETQQTIPLKISKQSIKVEHYVGNITIALVEGTVEKRVIWTVAPEENFQSLSLSSAKPSFTVICKHQAVAP